MSIDIHPSALAGWFDCPRRQFARSYPHLVPKKFNLPEKIRPRRIASSVGTIAHAAIAILLKQKKETGKNPVWDSGMPEALKEFDEHEEQGVIADGTTKDRKDLALQVGQIVKLYASRILPNVQPVLVEQKFTALLGHGFQTEGTIDALDRTIVRDVKTGQHEENHMLQGGLYLNILEANGIPADRFIVDWIPRSPEGKPKEPISKEYDAKLAKSEAKAAVYAVKAQIQNAIKLKEPWALNANSRSNLCNETDCPVFGSEYCQLWKEKI